MLGPSMAGLTTGLIVSAVRMKVGSISGAMIPRDPVVSRDDKYPSFDNEEAPETTEGILGLDVLCDIPLMISSGEDEAIVLAEGKF